MSYQFFTLPLCVELFNIQISIMAGQHVKLMSYFSFSCEWTELYHCPGVAVAFVDHFDRGSPNVLGLALLHLPSFFPPPKQLLDTSSCRASDKQ